MSRDDAFKLLGGYATGTLTPAEREALFAAAMEDQALFNALADEEALRELLVSDAARRRLIGELEPRRPRKSWWYWAPAAAVAAGLMIAGVVWMATPRRLALVQMAQVARPPAREFVPPPEPQPKAVEQAPAPPVISNRVDIRKAAPKALMAEAAAAPPPAPTMQMMAMPAAGFRGGVAGGVPGSVTQTITVTSEAAIVQTLSIAVMQRGENDSYLQTSPLTVFHAGDAVKLQITAAGAGALTVSDGAGAVLYASAVKAGEKLLWPSGDAIVLAGSRTFSVRLDNATPIKIILRFD